jgi:hypothetical protein
MQFIQDLLNISLDFNDPIKSSSLLFLFWAILTLLVVIFAARVIIDNPSRYSGEMFVYTGVVMIFIGVVFIDLISDNLNKSILSTQLAFERSLIDKEVSLVGSEVLPPKTVAEYKIELDKIIMEMKIANDEIVRIYTQLQNYFERIILLVSGGVGGSLIAQGIVDKFKFRNSPPVRVIKLKRRNQIDFRRKPRRKE